MATNGERNMNGKNKCKDKGNESVEQHIKRTTSKKLNIALCDLCQFNNSALETHLKLLLLLFFNPKTARYNGINKYLAHLGQVIVIKLDYSTINII